MGDSVARMRELIEASGCNALKQISETHWAGVADYVFGAAIVTLCDDGELERFEDRWCYRTRGEAPTTRSGSVSPMSLALLRGRFGAIETSRVLLPVASFADADSYIGAVLAGMWFGVEDLSMAEKAQLERDLRKDLREELFPIVEYRPWIVSRGRKR